MAQKKVKFTLIDALIIVAVIAAAAVVFAVFAPAKMSAGGNQTKAVFTVMLTGKDKDFADAISVGDVVSISNKEKDTGVVTAVEAKPAESLEYNANDGKYTVQTIDNKRDVYVTIEADATADDKLIQVGTTPVKVGLDMPVRGKGYASMGYIIKADTAEGGNAQ